MLSLAKFGRGIALPRLDWLLTDLGIDRQRLSELSVVICGSNGKGSCAAICESIARAAGLKTGLFTSPHLFHFSERFQINRQPITDVDWALSAGRVMSAIQRHPNVDDFGAFEAQFAIACDYFQVNQCEFMIFEAGIGGRYDPVRLVDAGRVAVTSLDLEHTALLGNSLEQIGYDKSDACSPNGQLFYGPQCKELMPNFEVFNRLRGVNNQWVSLHPWASEVALRGGFQRDNASVALALMLDWLNQYLSATPEQIAAICQRGLRTVRWAGRLETINLDPLIVIDVGHSPDAIRKAIEGLNESYPDTEWICVTGVSNDKDATGILYPLAQRFDQFICTRAQHKGELASRVAAQIFAVKSHAKVTEAASIIEALEQARLAIAQLNKDVNQPVGIFVAGGLFLAIEFATAVYGQDPQSLTFF